MTDTWTELGKSINRLRFKSKIWGNSAVTEERVMNMIMSIQRLSGLPVMSKDDIWEGMQYRHIFAKPYSYALEELKHLCYKDW